MTASCSWVLSPTGAPTCARWLMLPVVVQILVIEGLHPFFDDRVAELCDFKIYLDISDEVTSPSDSILPACCHG